MSAIEKPFVVMLKFSPASLRRADFPELAAAEANDALRKIGKQMEKWIVELSA